MVGRFFGRDIIKRPTCPFCGLAIEKPKELETRMPSEMPVGSCSCGAVYAFDTTGHSLGTAMTEALVFGCNGDWDLAWDLLPDEDYIEAQVKNYDIESHLVVSGGAYEGRSISGVLYFVRLHKDVREVTEEGTRKRLEKATPVTPEPSLASRGKKSFSKKEVESLVRDYNIEPLLEFAKQDKRIIRDLKRLLYSVDLQLRLRAAEMLGRVSAEIAKYDPGAVSKLLQSLFTAVSDTAASSWGYLDAIGEIVFNNPEQFGGYMPQLFQYLSDRALLSQALRALGKIAEEKPKLLRKMAFHFVPLLKDPDDEIRGYATILLGNLGAKEAKDDLSNLTDDSSTLERYANGVVEKTSVALLASEALNKL